MIVISDHCLRANILLAGMFEIIVVAWFKLLFFAK